MVNFLSRRQFVAVVSVARMWISMSFCSSVVINSEMFSMGELISSGLPLVAVCFAQGDPSQRSWEYSSSSSEVGPRHVCSHEGVCVYHFGKWKPLDSTAFWWIYWMSSYRGWKQGLFSKADIHNRCAETTSLTPLAQLGQTAPLNCVNYSTAGTAQQLPSDGRRRLASSDAQSSFPPPTGAAWNSFASKVLRDMI